MSLLLYQVPMNNPYRPEPVKTGEPLTNLPQVVFVYLSVFLLVFMVYVRFPSRHSGWLKETSGWLKETYEQERDACLFQRPLLFDFLAFVLNKKEILVYSRDLFMSIFLAFVLYIFDVL